VESVLYENKLIGLAWAVLDYDDAASESHAFWNLSRQHTMYGKADELVAFRLMPLEPQFRKFDANWSFQVIDIDRRMVAFRDETTGKATAWRWDFGDGTTSTEQNPIHRYTRGGDYIVALDVEGPEGKSRREKIWDVALRQGGGRMKRFVSVLFLSLAGLGAQMHPVEESIEAARTNSPKLKDLLANGPIGLHGRDGSAVWGQDFLFAVESDKPATVSVDHQPDLTMTNIPGAKYWYRLVTLRLGTTPRSLLARTSFPNIGTEQDFLFPPCFTRFAVARAPRDISNYYAADRWRLELATNTRDLGRVGPFEKTPTLQALQPPDSQDDSGIYSSYSRTLVTADESPLVHADNIRRRQIGVVECVPSGGRVEAAKPLGEDAL